MPLECLASERGEKVWRMVSGKVKRMKEGVYKVKKGNNHDMWHHMIGCSKKIKNKIKKHVQVHVVCPEEWNNLVPISIKVKGILVRIIIQKEFYF